MNEIPPPNEADLSIDLSDEITNGFAEWAHGSNGPPWVKYLAVIRRCHAAETERDRLRSACDRARESTGGRSMKEVPPPSEADMEIDIPGEYEYSYLVEKDERCEFRVQFVLGLLRRCHAAEAERDQLRERAERAEDVLRSLASWLSAGGYQSTNVDAAEYEAKIRWGVDQLLKVETDRREKAEADLTEAVAALGPFAKYIDEYPPFSADCRRAAAIVAKHKGAL